MRYDIYGKLSELCDYIDQNDKLPVETILTMYDEIIKFAIETDSSVNEVVSILLDMDRIDAVVNLQYACLFR